MKLGPMAKYEATCMMSTEIHNFGPLLLQSIDTFRFNEWSNSLKDRSGFWEILLVKPLEL